MSIKDEAIIKAYDDGYKVVGKKLLTPSGAVRKLYINQHGYPEFTHRIHGKKRGIVVHRLVAYQKFGSGLFAEGIEVRHLDGDRENFSKDNIAIGTASDNYYDIPEEVRKRKLSMAVKAAAVVNRKWSDEEVENIRNRYHETRSYRIVMEEFNITSKGSLHYIINNTYEAR